MKRKVLALVAIAAFAAAGLLTINSMAQQGPPPGKPGEIIVGRLCINWGGLCMYPDGPNRWYIVKGHFV